MNEIENLKEEQTKFKLAERKKWIFLTLASNLFLGLSFLLFSGPSVISPKASPNIQIPPGYLALELEAQLHVPKFQQDNLPVPVTLLGSHQEVIVENSYFLLAEEPPKVVLALRPEDISKLKGLPAGLLHVVPYFKPKLTPLKPSGQPHEIFL